MSLKREVLVTGRVIPAVPEQVIPEVIQYTLTMTEDQAKTLALASYCHFVDGLRWASDALRDLHPSWESGHGDLSSPDLVAGGNRTFITWERLREYQEQEREFERVTEELAELKARPVLTTPITPLSPERIFDMLSRKQAGASPVDWHATAEAEVTPEPQKWKVQCRYSGPEWFTYKGWVCDTRNAAYRKMRERQALRVNAGVEYRVVSADTPDGVDNSPRGSYIVEFWYDVPSRPRQWKRSPFVDGKYTTIEDAKLAIENYGHTKSTYRVKWVAE